MDKINELYNKIINNVSLTEEERKDFQAKIDEEKKQFEEEFNEIDEINASLADYDEDEDDYADMYPFAVMTKREQQDFIEDEIKRLNRIYPNKPFEECLSRAVEELKDTQEKSQNTMRYYDNKKAQKEMFSNMTQEEIEEYLDKEDEKYQKLLDKNTNLFKNTVTLEIKDNEEEE